MLIIINLINKGEDLHKSSSLRTTDSVGCMCSLSRSSSNTGGRCWFAKYVLLFSVWHCFCLFCSVNCVVNLFLILLFSPSWRIFFIGHPAEMNLW